jgi:hypothetical protein
MGAAAARFLAASALFIAHSSGQTLSEPNSDIVDRLFADAFPPRVVELNSAERVAAVTQLLALRPTATGARLQKVAFLLAALGSGYCENRDLLVNSLRDCRVPLHECDEDTAGLLIGLYAQRHHEVLPALLQAGGTSDGALADMLGPFYGEVLIAQPAEFIAGLRHLNVQTRTSVCELTGSGDGGGVSPEDLRAIRQRLKRLDEAVARGCLRDIERSNRNAEASNSPAALRENSPHDR